MNFCFVIEFCDTWAFLEDRVKDAFDMKKTIQEVGFSSFYCCLILCFLYFLAEGVILGTGNVLGRSCWCGNGKFFAKVFD